MTTVQHADKVIASEGIKQVRVITSSERRTLVTMVVAVNACRKALPPTFVFLCVKFTDYFIENGPSGSIGTANPSGWMKSSNFLFCKALICTYKAFISAL